jgi:SLT domain-containing protein
VTRRAFLLALPVAPKALSAPPRRARLLGPDLTCAIYAMGEERLAEWVRPRGAGRKRGAERMISALAGGPR